MTVHSVVVSVKKMHSDTCRRWSGSPVVSKKLIVSHRSSPLASYWLFCWHPFLPMLSAVGAFSFLLALWKTTKAATNPKKYRSSKTVSFDDLKQ